MANQLNKYGITIEAQTAANISTNLSGSEDTVLLYASGSGANAALYVKSGGNTQKQLGVDIDQYSALGGTGLHDSQDHFLFSDNGTEMKITWANLYGAVFGKVSGDATVGSGGALTIGSSAVESGMLNNNIISGQTELAQAGLVAADELMISDGGTIKRYGVDSLAKDALALTTEAAMAVGNDYIVFLDGGATGETKKEQFSDVVGNMAGDGIDGTSGVLSVSSAQTTITSLKHDSLVIGRSSGNDDITFSDDTIDLMTNDTSRLKVQTANTTISNNLIVEGNLTVEGSAVEVQQGFVVTASIQFEGSTPDGNELTLTTANPTADRTVTIPDLSGHVPLLAGAISTANVTAAEFALLDGGSTVGTTALASGDGFMHNDNGTMKQTRIDKLADLFAGNGLAAASSVMAVDLNELSAAAVAVGADSIAIIDADDNGTKKESIADLMTATAGSGLGASSGVLAVNVSGAVHVSSDKVSISGSIAGDGLAYAGGVNSISGLSVNVDDSSLQISSDSLRVKAEGVTNAMLAGSIANAKLANSSITVTDGSNTTAIALGNSITFSGTNNEVDVAESSGTVTIGLPASVAITTGLSVPTCGVTTTLAVGGGYGSDGLTVDTNGTLTMDGNLSVGVNTSASDVSFYGADSGDGLFWDGTNSRLGLDKSAQAGYAVDVAEGKGNVRADGFVTYSDRELKQNIASIDDSLDKIMKLDAVSYDMKSDGRHEIGFIAQDVAKVVPEICALDNNGVGRGIDYGRLTSLLAGAVKTQQNQIAELKAAIAKLNK